MYVMELRGNIICESHDHIDLYHISFPHDRWLSRGTFYMLWAVETAQTVLLTHDAFNSFVRSFGSMVELDEVQDAWLAGPISDATGTMHVRYCIQNAYR